MSSNMNQSTTTNDVAAGVEELLTVVFDRFTASRHSNVDDSQNYHSQEGDTSPPQPFLPPFMGDDVDPTAPILESAEDSHNSNREWLVYFCFLCLGLGTLLPWNFFITAESYWQYKFRDTTNAEEGTPTQLQTLYTPMQVCLSQILNFTFLIMNALFSHRISIRLRLMVTLILMILLFVVTTALVLVDSDLWQIGFFAITMTIIVLLNICGALFQGGLFGLAGMFPARYMTAAVTGQAVGGVFASGARIVSLLIGADDINSAFIFFMIAVGVMCLTLGALCYLTNSTMYRHVTGSAQTGDRKDIVQQQESEPFSASALVAQSTRVFMEIWPIGLSVCVVFWTTLAAFPAVCVKIVSTSSDTKWANIYFQPVLTFLLFNVGDLVGRQLAGLLLWPRRGSRLLYALVASRLIFIPLLLLCNHTGSTSFIPSLFTGDVAYFVIMSLLSFSNGYLGSLCMIYGPKYVSNSRDAEQAGSLMAAMLGLGLLLGAATSFPLDLIL